MVVITIIGWGYKPTYNVLGLHVVDDQPMSMMTVTSKNKTANHV